MEEITKRCGKCGRELPLSEFNKDKSRKDGLQRMCKDCMKQYNAEHRDKRKQYNKQYYADNREHVLEQQKQWDADNREHKKQYMKQYRKQYYSTLEGYVRSIRWNNLQADRKYGRCGKDEDPLPSIEEYIELLQQRDYYDGKHYHWSEMGVDRIDNSKPHTIDNVVPCTTEHNRQRGTKTFEEFRSYIQNSF